MPFSPRLPGIAHPSFRQLQQWPRGLAHSCLSDHADTHPQLSAWITVAPVSVGASGHAQNPARSPLPHHKPHPTLSTRNMYRIAAVQQHLSRKAISVALWLLWRPTIDRSIESPVSYRGRRSGWNITQSPALCHNDPGPPRGARLRGLSVPPNYRDEYLLVAHEVAAILRVSERWVRDHTTPPSPKAPPIQHGPALT